MKSKSALGTNRLFLKDHPACIIPQNMITGHHSKGEILLIFGFPYPIAEKTGGSKPLLYHSIVKPI